MTCAKATANTAARAEAAPAHASGAAAANAGLRVRLFAALRERAGWGDRNLALPPDQVPVTPLAIWERLQLGPWPTAMRVAVNQEFAAADQPLAPGDELAFLPPISGG